MALYRKGDVIYTSPPDHLDPDAGDKPVITRAGLSMIGAAEVWDYLVTHLPTDNGDEEASEA